MNASLLILLGAFDTLIAIIQNDRAVFGNAFDPDAAVQTLKKIKSEFVNQILASTRAQVHASEILQATIEQLRSGLPQGSELESLVRSLQQTVATFLPQGPPPPWPSSSSSKKPLGLALEGDLAELIGNLQSLTELKRRP